MPPSTSLALGARSLHAGKSPGEWSAGESLLMLEDACKNERKHSKYSYCKLSIIGGFRINDFWSNDLGFASRVE